MGFLDKLLGREPVAQGRPPQGGYQGRASSGGGPRSELSPDQAAIERYRYLLRTAPPDRIEEAHREAFEKLTPEQRRQVLAELSSEVPPAERATSDDPRSLARMATRAEMRNPGTLERSFSRPGMGGMGMGGMLAGSLLASVAGAFIGTAIADAMFDMSDNDFGGDEAAEGGDSGDSGDAGDAGGADVADAGYDGGGFDGGGFDGGFDGGGFDGGGF